MLITFIAIRVMQSNVPHWRVVDPELTYGTYIVNCRQEHMIYSTGFLPQHRSRHSMTSIGFSLVCTKLSQVMADACTSEQESNSNESFGLRSSDGFSSSSSDSSEDDSLGFEN